MSNAWKLKSLLLSCSNLQKTTCFSSQVRWQTTAHSLSVRQRIKEKRDEALVGGGSKRIAAQHKKVIINIIYYYY